MKRTHRIALAAAVAALAVVAARPAVAQATETTLYTFSAQDPMTGANSDGAQPHCALIQAPDNNFYGTATQGGTSGAGTVFRLTPAGGFTILHQFVGGASDGGSPSGGLVLGTDGNLYGVTLNGGPAGCGTVYEITTGGTLTILHAFTGPFAPDGCSPYGALTLGADGNLYGVTTFGSGSIFKIPQGGGTFTTVFTFGSGTTDPRLPVAAPIQGTDGNFYGTTVEGGANNTGTIYQLTPGGTFTVLHEFAAITDPMSNTNADGAYPSSLLLQASDGNLYGACPFGGSGGDGTIFKIPLGGGAFSVVHNFLQSESIQANALIEANDGNLYGATVGGGTNFTGEVYQLTLGGAFSIIYNFTSVSSGTNSDGNGVPFPLLQGLDGNLYGAATAGGANMSGTIFSINAGLPRIPSQILGFNPSSVDACGPAFTLQVLGRHFESGSTVTWDGSPLTTTFVSTSELDAYVPASLITMPYNANIQVVGPDGLPGNVMQFAILDPVPTLSSISPTSVAAGGSGFTLTVTGKCFLFRSVVNWNGSPLTTSYVSSTRLKATVPAALTASPGTASVTVSTPGPGGGTSAAKTITIVGAKLKLTGASLSRDPVTGNITVMVTITNAGGTTANNVNITMSKLGAAATATPLPVNLGAIGPGGSASASLVYPGTAGPPGASVKLVVSGLFTGGKFSGTRTVTLP